MLLAVRIIMIPSNSLNTKKMAMIILSNFPMILPACGSSLLFWGVFRHDMSFCMNIEAGVQLIQTIKAYTIILVNVSFSIIDAMEFVG